MGTKSRLIHLRYDGPAFAPGERVEVADDRETSLSRARGCVGVVLCTLGPFVVVQCRAVQSLPVAPWLPPSSECGVRAVLPEFLYPLPTPCPESPVPTT